jgi:hypothetical protein
LKHSAGPSEVFSRCTGSLKAGFGAVSKPQAFLLGNPSRYCQH